MQSLLDQLIFPAPSATYSHESLKGLLIYIPKFELYKPEPTNFSSSFKKRKNTLDQVQLGSILKTKVGTRGISAAPSKDHSNYNTA